MPSTTTGSESQNKSPPSSPLESKSSGDDGNNGTWLEPIIRAEKTATSDPRCSIRPGTFTTGGKPDSDSLRNLGRTRSQNGYGCDDTDVDDDEEAATQTSAAVKDPWEVGWDLQQDGGRLDPLNPRAMPFARKWAVVLIISLASLCV